MKLKCRINGKNYDIVQGAAFADEWNETLDSGTIMLSSVDKIEGLLPYDDVFIWNAEQDFLGYKYDEEKKCVVHYDSNEEEVNLKFYKHLLVDTFSEELINIDENKYKYRIQLFSETKALENIVLPNTSITQPINVAKRKNIYEYLKMFLNMYNPKIRRLVNEDNWEFEDKYILDSNLETIFSNVYSPEFSLNNPTLKELFTQLMNVMDCIPIVKDNVISVVNLTELKKESFAMVGEIKHVSGSMTSGDFCDSLRKNYDNALSSDNTCRLIEKIGFRNNSSFNMTLENMRLETAFPIYKINRLLICYYKKAKLVQTGSDGTVTQKDCVFLCKQDITPLVLTENVRNMLSQDWTEINTTERVLSVKEMASYKYCTLGYSIGSNYVTGWGETYNYLRNFFQQNETQMYIENILENIDKINPFGVEIYSDILNKKTIEISDENVYEYKDLNENDFIFLNENNLLKNLYNPFKSDNEKINNTVKYKQFLFIVDYEGFYNGVVNYSKDDLERENITKIDNSSSSLTLMEKDGVSAKEKVKRFSNKGVSIVARYNNINQLQDIGTLYTDDRYEKNMIIYHREYSIYDNYIIANYQGTKNYVLRNYFTSVFSKYRLYNLMSYSESTKRAENRKLYLYLSTEKKYNEKIDNISNKLLDNCINIYNENKNINNNKMTAIIEEKNGNKYLCDVNKFSTGNSICFNFKMFDNISMGNYISKPSPDFNIELDYNEVKGSIQTLLMLENDNGFIDELKYKIYLGDINEKDKYVINLHENNPLVKVNIKDIEGLVNSLGSDKEYAFVLTWDSSKDKWSLSLWNTEDNSVKQLYGYVEKYGISITGAGASESIIKFFIKEDKKDITDSIVINNQDNYIKNVYENYYFKYPLYDNEITSNVDMIFDVKNIDNKEYVDMTFEIETISNDKNIYFSNWTSKLSNVLSNYYKSNEDFIIEDSTKFNNEIEMCYIRCNYDTHYSDGQTYVQHYKIVDDSIYPNYVFPLFIVRIKKDEIENFKDKELSCSLVLNSNTIIDTSYSKYRSNLQKMILEFKKINYVNDDEISFSVNLNGMFSDNTIFKNNDKTFKFVRMLKQNNVYDEGIEASDTSDKSLIPYYVKYQDNKYVWVKTQTTEYVKDYLGEEYGLSENVCCGQKIYRDSTSGKETYQYFYQIRYSGTAFDYFDDKELNDGYYYYMFCLNGFLYDNENACSLLDNCTDERKKFNYNDDNENNKVFVFSSSGYTFKSSYNNLGSNKLNYESIENGVYYDFINKDIFNYDVWKESFNQQYNGYPLYYDIKYNNTGYQKGNLLVIYDKEKMNETIKYKTIYEDNFKGYLSDTKEVIDKKISDVFQYEYDRQSIKIDLTDVDEDVQSIQYWYFDMNSKSYVFVIGFNITEEMQKNKKINIYSSLISSKDLRVWDEYNNVIGKIKNIADSNNIQDYDEQKVEKQ